MISMRKTSVISILIVAFLVAASVLLSFMLHRRSTEAETDGDLKWSGMDESVIEKYAEESGRTPAEPLIPVEEGDLLLFLFAIGGFFSGCLVGYLWRKLFGEKASPAFQDEPKGIGS